MNLALAALLIAKEEYPTLDIGSYLLRLDRMAEAIRTRVGANCEPRKILTRLNQFLFEEEGFHGNSQDYYDPRNSYLNEVLDRRTGIPITISTVYLEVGKRLGLPLVGVGLPGHFLVKLASPESEIVLDPFGGGAETSPTDCQRLLDKLHEGRIALHPRHLAAVTTRQILCRMLNNLKGIYVRTDQYGKALAVVERLLILYPDSASDIRDHGLLACQLKRYGDATRDLDRYLRLAPQAEDHDTIRDHLRSIRERVGALN
jgi:regulator of sirC expression with transglutaminase-like and TPR domain